MKVVLDLTSLADNFSGIERFAMSVSEELIKNYKNEYILIFKNYVYPVFEKFNNVKKIVIYGTNKLFFNQIVLPWKLLSIKADLYLFLAFPAPFLWWKENTVSAIHDVGCWDCPGANTKFKSLYFKILYRKATLFNKKIITVSEFSKNRIMDLLKVRKDNIGIVYNGLSKHLVNNKVLDKNKKQEVILKYKLPSRYILCLSTLEPRKNLKLLVAAFSELIMNNEIDTNLVLAGRKGWLVDDLLLDVPDFVKKRIYFTGFVDDEELPYIYGLASMFIFPSIYEGFGVPPIEAMCMNSLVISSNAAALPEVLRDGALYFKSNDIESLKKKIIEVNSWNDTKKNKQINKGRQICKLYSWEKSAEMLSKFVF